MNDLQGNIGTIKNQTPDSFEIWVGERPRWLQSAARLLIDNKRMPNDTEISDLAELCIKEASGEQSGFTQIIPGALASASQRAPLRINKIASVVGVNAIRDGASLSFGNTNLAVVYGANGTGKTGFSRLLKDACGSKAKDEILGNVFSTNAVPAAAQIDISINNVEQSIHWSLAGGPLAILRHVHVFDTKTASMYMGKTEASYEPSRMRFISSLIKVCDLVSSYISQKKNLLTPKLPLMPADLASTASATWLSTLKSTTKPQAIELKCQFSKELDDERINSEAALAQKDVVGRIQAITQDKLALQRVKASIDTLKSGLADTVILAFISAKNDANMKRHIATEEAKKVFANVALDGVGQNTWMALWKQATLFSEQHAYPNAKFPYLGDGARCVLCQQTLQSDGVERMSHFQAYVQSGLESEAKAAEKLRDELSKQLPVLPTEQDWIVHMSLIKVPEDTAKHHYGLLAARRQSVEEASSIDSVPVFEWADIESAYVAIMSSLDLEEKTLSSLLHDDKRQALQLRVKELRAMQWLHQNMASILDEQARLTQVSVLDAAIKLVSTSQLTKKNNELAETEIEKGYEGRFANELKKLGGNRLPVKPFSKKEGKGRITFGLELIGSQSTIKAERILSEGETRIVALAAFLADITGSGQRYPFIFDDPISSLDQDFEERVVARLVELATERQVIVFTHRLSLLSLVESTVKKLKEQAQEQKLPAPVTVTVETLRKLNSSAGVVAKLSLRDSKPAKAVARIKDEFIPQLKKHVASGDADKFERDAWQVCSEIRILVERCVESILLNEVLVRFRRDVQTKGKLLALTKIEKMDCDFLDDLMTRYSVFEHSQSDNLPAPSPELSVIEQDIDELVTWIDTFAKR